MSGHGLGQTLLAQFHHERAGMIVFIVLVPQPSAAVCFAGRFQHLPDHQGFELLGYAEDFLGGIGFVGRC
jgi:hypothetical protein